MDVFLFRLTDRLLGGFLFSERVGVQVVECACVIELAELKVRHRTIYQ